VGEKKEKKRGGPPAGKGKGRQKNRVTTRAQRSRNQVGGKKPARERKKRKKEKKTLGNRAIGHRIQSKTLEIWP